MTKEADVSKESEVTEETKEKYPQRRWVNTAIYVVMIAALIAVVTFLFTVAKGRWWDFDRAFQQDSININSAGIPLGGEGHPALSKGLADVVPDNWGYTLGKLPREYFLTGGCKAMNLREGTVAVHAATEFPAPEVFEIHVPPYDVGTLLVCIPEESTLRIVLWAEIDKK